MGLHKNNDDGNTTTTANQPEKKMTAIKAIRLGAGGGGGKAAAWKWTMYAKKHQAQHLQEMKKEKEEEEQQEQEEKGSSTAGPLPQPLLSRKASTVSLVSNDDTNRLMTTSVLQEPIKEFPLDAIPEVITLSSATQALFVDPISLLVGNDSGGGASQDIPPIITDILEGFPTSAGGVAADDNDSCTTNNNSTTANNNDNNLVGWTATWIE